MGKSEDDIIEDIINSESVLALYQPLVFIRKKQIGGYEALSRGLDPETGKHISPVTLIESAEKYGLVLQIDRLFRKKCLEGFSGYFKESHDMIMSVRFNGTSVKGGFGSKQFSRSVESFGIDPSCVVIEVSVPGFEDTGILTDFVSQYRELGFMISVDDFSTGFLDIERIALLKPDIIKVGKSITGNIENSFFRQQVAGTLVNIAHNTGALVIAEGVETEPGALKLMELNVDILQGYYFSDPCELDKVDIPAISAKIDRLSSLFHEGIRKKHSLKASKVRQYRTIMNRIVKDILDSEMYLPDDAVKRAVEKYRGVECVYILDGAGIQVSDTIINSKLYRSGRSRIFHPDSMYSDQSNKDYYYELQDEGEYFITEPYISAASGNMCITISGRYCTPGDEKRIICVDISV